MSHARQAVDIPFTYSCVLLEFFCYSQGRRDATESLTSDPQQQTIADKRHFDLWLDKASPKTFETLWIIMQIRQVIIVRILRSDCHPTRRNVVRGGQRP